MDKGLARCPVGLPGAHPGGLREGLFVPEDHRFACAAALGYLVEDDPVNVFASPRRGIERVERVF